MGTFLNREKLRGKNRIWSIAFKLQKKFKHKEQTMKLILTKQKKTFKTFAYAFAFELNL